MSETVQGKAKAASASVREKAGDLKSKAGKTVEPKPTPKPKTDPKPKKPPAVETPKPRGRPKGSTNKPKTTTAKTTTAKKTTTSKTTASKTTTAGKRGPKPGTKIPRDKDGNLLKKDGTPRKKPGPKT